MDKYNLESIVGRLIGKLPKRWYAELVVNSSKDKDSWAMNYINKKIIFERSAMLAEEKFLFFVRAAAQLVLIHLLSLCLLWVGSHVSLSIADTLMATMMFVLPPVVNVTLCSQLLFVFHPIAFRNVLFEDDPAVSKKEYRALGLIVKAFAVAEIATIFHRTFVAYCNYATTKISVVDLVRETPCTNTILAGFVLTASWYLFWDFRTKKMYMSFTLSEDVHTVTIYERSGATQTVEPLQQFVIEKSGRQLYIGRIAPLHNPRYQETPKPYQIPIEAIEKMEIGGEQISYDFATQKWQT